MIILSLLLNVGVLLPVCYGIATGAKWARESYGDASVARWILLSVYTSILLVSLGLLLYGEPSSVAALLLVQIIYKLLSPFAVRTVANPVIISNLIIAVFHSTTLFLISRETTN